jgi:hypothetical protein
MPLKTNQYLAVHNLAFKAVLSLGIIIYCASGQSQERQTIKAFNESHATKADNPSFYKLTANTYFNPYEKNEDRSMWPDQLTLIPLKNPENLEQMKIKLDGSWTLAHHCDGRAIEKEKFIETTLSDGYYNPLLLLTFNFKDNIVKRDLFAPNSKILLSKENILSTDILIIQYADYNVSSNYPLNLNFINYTNVGYRLILLKETNEILIETNQPFTFNPKNRICPNGTVPNTLLVPILNLMS